MKNYLFTNFNVNDNFFIQCILLKTLSSKITSTNLFLPFTFPSIYEILFTVQLCCLSHSCNNNRKRKITLRWRNWKISVTCYGRLKWLLHLRRLTLRSTLEHISYMCSPKISTSLYFVIKSWKYSSGYRVWHSEIL